MINSGEIPLIRDNLDRFASDGKVTVRRRDGRSFDANPDNVAVESGFYDVPDGIGGVSKEVETGLADVEAEADAVLREIDRLGRLPAPTNGDRVPLALFVGLQVARTTEHRERVLFPRRVVDWANGREVTRDLVAEYLETQHLGHTPAASEVDGAYMLVTVAVRDAPETLTDEFAIEMMLRGGWEVSRRLLGLNWSLEFSDGGEFVTSDSPVVVWRKPSSRDDYQGVGIENATELRFPLDPGKQLVLSRRERASRLEVAMHRVRRSNEVMAGACHRFVVGRPANRARIEALHLDRVRPVLRFNVGPALMEGPDGLLRPTGGEVLHMWKPARAGVGRPRPRPSTLRAPKRDTSD